MAGNIHIRYQ